MNNTRAIAAADLKAGDILVRAGHGPAARTFDYGNTVGNGVMVADVQFDPEGWVVILWVGGSHECQATSTVHIRRIELVKAETGIRVMPASEVQVGDLIIDSLEQPLKAKFARSYVIEREEPLEGATFSPFNLITFRTTTVTMRFRPDHRVLIDTSAHQEQITPQNLDQIED